MYFFSGTANFGAGGYIFEARYPDSKIDGWQVRNTGSWMEIGNSISHFGIVSAQVVFVLLLFALTNTYTKNIQCNSAVPATRKAN